MLYTVTGLMLTSSTFLALEAPYSFILATVGIMLILMDVVKMSSTKPATVNTK